jgi:hypothetical protein
VCEESGTDLAQLVRKKVKVQQKQAATSQASTSALASLSHSSDIHVVQPMDNEHRPCCWVRSCPAFEPDHLNESFTGADTGSGVEQAMGRVLGSLCVLTSRDDDAESGMLASWVSQASFDPPGLTVAVKKDRAVENLLQVGNRFNLNVLKDGGDKARFTPDQMLVS